MYTAREIACWMLAQIERHGQLERRQASTHIRREFGEQFIHRVRKGSGAIREEILEEFRALAPDTVIWSFRDQTWRWRNAEDPLGTRIVR